MSAPLHRVAFPGALRSGGAPSAAVRFDFVATTSSPDRVGDLVDASGLDWKAWRKNPVVLFGHDHERPVARGIGPRRTSAPDGWAIGVLFPEPGRVPFSDQVRELVSAGVISAVSIGFRPGRRREPTKDERKRGVSGVVFETAEILEVSLVSVPANSEALRLAFKDSPAVLRSLLPELDPLQEARREVRKALARVLASPLTGQ